MTALELADAMEIRASIRKKATNRKSVQENANDRLADQLTQAATMLRQQQAEIGRLKQIIDANNLNQNIGQFVKPANEPYLTDEKIWKLWQTHLNDEITVFAKALLKEASEK